MPEIHAARRARAQAQLAELEADAVLVTAPPNVRYLTGLDSSNAALLLPADGTGLLATDSRYQLAAQRDAPDLELTLGRFIEPLLGAEAGRRGLRRLAVETHHLTVDQYDQIAGADENPRPVSFGKKIEELRTVKDPSELELIATACRITDQALAGVLPLIRPGLSEHALATALDHRMAELGASGGVRHHRGQRAQRRAPAPRAVRAAAAPRRPDHHGLRRAVRGLSRRHDPDRGPGGACGWQRDLYQLVATAQRAGCTAARPGAALREVDAAARDVIAEAGHGEHFGHGLGHGVGLEVHEAPMIGYGSTGKLEARVSVTVEPGVYLPGQGGVRIEDVLIVGAGAADGAAEILTRTTKELLAL